MGRYALRHLREEQELRRALPAPNVRPGGRRGRCADGARRRRRRSGRLRAEVPVRAAGDPGGGPEAGRAGPGPLARAVPRHHLRGGQAPAGGTLRARGRPPLLRALVAGAAGRGPRGSGGEPGAYLVSESTSINVTGVYNLIRAVCVQLTAVISNSHMCVSARHGAPTPHFTGSPAFPCEAAAAVRFSPGSLEPMWSSHSRLSPGKLSLIQQSTNSWCSRPAPTVNLFKRSSGTGTPKYQASLLVQPAVVSTTLPLVSVFHACRQGK